MKQGDAAKKAGEYKKADTIYQAGLAAARKIGPSDTRVASSLVSLAALYEQAGNHSQIEILHKLAVVVEEKGQGKDHPAVAMRLSGLARYCQSRTRYADAESMLLRAIAIVEKPGANKADLAKTLDQYAGVLRLLNRPDDAAKVAARAAALKGR